MLPIPDGFHEVKPATRIDCHVADPDLSPDHKVWVKALLLEADETGMVQAWQVWCPYCGHHRWGASQKEAVKTWNLEQRKASRRFNAGDT